jgi:hypothetical protein
MEKLMPRLTFLAYFEDDSAVVSHYTNGKVLAICEPWALREFIPRAL